MSEKQVPLFELLEEVPANARVLIETEFASTSHPVGRMAHEAAAELRRLHAEIQCEEQRVSDLMEQVDRLGKENERLNEELAICRDAIEDAVRLVTDWGDDNDSDTDQGAARATRRKLSEAIGKAVPRLMMERPEGQKLYGLHWRELREENERLREAVAFAYGHLWHVNNEPAAPIPLRSPEKAAYEARKVLRDLLTTPERGNGIERARAALAKETTK